VLLSFLLTLHTALDVVSSSGNLFLAWNLSDGGTRRERERTSAYPCRYVFQYQIKPCFIQVGHAFHACIEPSTLSQLDA
jgi:hypothetical protein